MRNKLKSTYTLFNADTGEAYAVRDYTHPPRILKSTNNQFRKVFNNRDPDLSHTDMGKWYILSGYLEQNTNRLIKREMDERTGWLKNKSLTIDDMVKILSISKRSLYRFLKECFEKGYIRIGAHGDYYMSPLYVMNGAWIKVELYLIFRDVKEFNTSLSNKEKAIISAYLGIEVDDDERIE